MYYYTAYGLNIHSELELPQLFEGSEIADVTVRYGSVSLSVAELGDSDRVVIGSPQEVKVFWREIGSFCVRNGNEIIMDPNEGVDSRAIGLIILGSSLGILMTQRDRMVFHSSVVEFPRGCAAFVANRGYGKSTTAGALYAKGHRLVADDILTLDLVDGQYMARPGYPQLKLWPDAARAIGEQPESLDKVHPDFEKRARPARESFVREPVALRAVFILEVGKSVEVTRLEGQQALMSLLPHWYGAQFDGDLLEVFGIEDHFKACNLLAQSVPIYRIGRPHKLDYLEEVVTAIEKTLE